MGVLIWTSVPAFPLIPSYHIQLHGNNLAAATSGFSANSSKNNKVTKSQRIRAENILDNALVSNCTAAQLILDKISNIQNIKKEEELDLLFGQLLFLVDTVGKDKDCDTQSFPTADS